jgi:hypothetical protein
MPKPAITTQFHESLNVHGHFSPKFSFNLVLAVNNLSDLADLVLTQVIRLGIRVYARFTQYLSGGTPAQSVNVGQRYLYSLVFW